MSDERAYQELLTKMSKDLSSYSSVSQKFSGSLKRFLPMENYIEITVEMVGAAILIRLNR